MPVESFLGKLRRGKIRGTKTNIQEFYDRSVRTHIQEVKAKQYQAVLDDDPIYIYIILLNEYQRRKEGCCASHKNIRKYTILQKNLKG